MWHIQNSESTNQSQALVYGRQSGCSLQTQGQVKTGSEIHITSYTKKNHKTSCCTGSTCPYIATPATLAEHDLLSSYCLHTLTLTRKLFPFDELDHTTPYSNAQPAVRGTNSRLSRYLAQSLDLTQGGVSQ